MNTNLETLLKLTQEIDTVGSQLNSVKAELRVKELDLKTLKLKLEFDPEFTEGLKVKEIPNKVHQETINEQKEICDLKAKRDDLELEFKVLNLQIGYTRELIEAEKLQ